MDIQIAVSTVKKALNSESGLFDALQSSIAQAFRDEAARHDLHISNEKLTEIANNGAKSFLQQWASHPEAEEPVQESEPAKEDKPVKKAGKSK